MAQSGESIDAAQQREAVLAGRNATAAGTDVALQSLLTKAHQTATDLTGRLDRIEDALNEGVARQASVVKTSLGARQFQRFLADKHRQILQVMDDARQSGSELHGQMQALSSGYTFPADYTTTPVSPPPAAPDPNDPGPVSRGAIDGVHGTGDYRMPVVLKPGELGPYGYQEVVPGTGVWVPPGQISGKMVVVPPGTLAPWGYQQIGTAPDGSGLWWYVPPGPR